MNPAPLPPLALKAWVPRGATLAVAGAKASTARTVVAGAVVTAMVSAVPEFAAVPVAVAVNLMVPAVSGVQVNVNDELARACVGIVAEVLLRVQQDHIHSGSIDGRGGAYPATANESSPGSGPLASVSLSPPPARSVAPVPGPAGSH